LLHRREIDPAALLAVLLASAGLLAYATSFMFDKLPLMFARVYFEWSPSPEGWFVVQFALSLLVMLPATVALGGIFPTVLQLHARSLEGVSGSVGTVYASNTFGTIFGAAAAGFFLVPRLGVRDTVVMVSAVEIALGLAAVAWVMSARRSRRLAFAAPMVAALILVAAVRPTWDVLLMNSGVYMNLQDLDEDAPGPISRPTPRRTTSRYSRWKD
jgi:spermidine synthase